jgi:hypothetical protein
MQSTGTTQQKVIQPNSQLKRRQTSGTTGALVPHNVKKLPIHLKQNLDYFPKNPLGRCGSRSC